MSDADTVFAIAAAMEAAVGHAKSRRDLASILWAATEAVGDDAPAAAAKLAAAADYVAGGGNLPSAGDFVPVHEYLILAANTSQEAHVFAK